MVWRPAIDPVGGVWSWPASGDLRPEVSVHNLYTVHITFTRRLTDLDGVAAVIAERLALFHLMVTLDDRGRTRLILTVQTSDLWQAVLLALNAVTSTDYMPVSLTAEPSSEFEAGKTSARR